MTSGVTNEIKLAVKEPDSVKLSYKRTRNIQLEYEEIQDHTI